MNSQTASKIFFFWLKAVLSSYIQNNFPQNNFSPPFLFSSVHFNKCSLRCYPAMPGVWNTKVNKRVLVPALKELTP